AGESAKFLLGATRVGMAPDAGASVTLARIVGLRKAMEIALLNPTLTAAEAAELGIVNRVVPDDAVLTEAWALARRLADGAARAAAEGADVTIGDVDVDAAKTQAAAIGALSVALDVTDPASAQEAIARGGPFDILVNNAGIDHSGHFFGDVTPEQWRRLLAV